MVGGPDGLKAGNPDLEAMCSSGPWFSHLIYFLLQIVVRIMSDERFEDLFQEKTVTKQKLFPGDKVEAVVAGTSGENVFLDVGAKSEGVISAAELRNEDGELTVKPGDTLAVFLLAVRNGEMVFTTRIGSGQASVQELEDAFHSGIPVEGRVTGEIKGGFQVTVAGQRGFCPYSQMDIRRIENPDEYVDKTFSFKIIEFGNRGRNIILSARAVMEEERARQREALEQSLEEGMQVEGTVSSIREFGAFVDIGGVDGLIPISELAWGQVERVEDILEQGQKVQVVVKKLDWERDRISLSLKETLENPWERVEEKYPVGSVHVGRVSRLANFGAFISLEPGVDGLLHISKLGAGRRINHPREVLEPGQEITVKIDGVEREKQRISLVPEDFTDSAGTEKKEKESGREPSFRPQAPGSMGTLGDLLKAQLKK
ncbi:30S ribosomal protein S1 [Desulfolithobacter dissulfuricans]|uniref:30S ribosomal protein S1 n=2 Tax=Desulfolithobacter dissulfuricans TaxID=2795293 RepID=A0A915XKX5_9BACT|nr:30S ribosomal protein S1 [Desulfolithobacter dissulfuricans]